MKKALLSCLLALTCMLVAASGSFAASSNPAGYAVIYPTGEAAPVVLPMQSGCAQNCPCHVSATPCPNCPNCPLSTPVAPTAPEKKQLRQLQQFRFLQLYQ